MMRTIAPMSGLKIPPIGPLRLLLFRILEIRDTILSAFIRGSPSLRWKRWEIRLLCRINPQSAINPSAFRVFRG